MIKKFKTLFVVKSSLVSLYLALTIPLPFVSSEKLKIVSIIFFFFGLFLIISLTSDYVKTSDTKIYYKTSLLSNFLGKKTWEIFWKDIKLIKSLPTSQGSKVFYFSLNNDENYLVPQRIENFEEFISLIAKNTNLDIELQQFSYISPLWTYKLLTSLSVVFIVGEVIFFYLKYYQH